MRRGAWIAALLAGTLLALPASALARDARVKSFDGTEINTHFYPAKGLNPGERAPTILQGPGWSMSGEVESEGAAGIEGAGAGMFGVTGIGPLLNHGYNVLTWDPRGFGQSGGTVQIDDPKYEGRDVQALLDFVAAQPEAQLDERCRLLKGKRRGGKGKGKSKGNRSAVVAKKKRKKARRRNVCVPGTGDPRVGMAGGSYGGGIQLVSAAIDNRIDAIAPTIAWNSLLTSLFPEGNIKTGWGTVLIAAGAQGSLQGAGQSPNNPAGRQDPHFYNTVTNGLSTGVTAQDDLNWFDSKGPKHLLSRIKVPTLLIQGTPDTLFPLDEAVANFETIRRNTTASTGGKGKRKKGKGKKSAVAAKKKRKKRKKRSGGSSPVPTKMIWFCGGHGACFTGAGPESYVTDRTLAWFDRYLRNRTGVDTGPRFAWIADDGELRTSGRFPLSETGRLRASGSGPLPIVPGQGSGGLIFASQAPIAMNVPIPGPGAAANVVGAPSLNLTYSGNAVPANTFVYAQIVNPRNGFVLGNIATPIPVTLDGQVRSISRELEMVAARAPSAGGYTLQLTPSSTLYDLQRSTGLVNFSSIDVSLPIAEAGDEPAAAKKKKKKKKKNKKKKRKKKR
jgi:ABC-2 type transport system ATP-binding protein